MKSVKSMVVTVLVLVFYVFIEHASAQDTSTASATWEMTDPSSGGTETSVSTSGYISANDESFSNISVNQYTGPQESQRVRITTNEWPANQTTAIPGVYIEYTIAPNINAKLTLSNIQLGIAAMSVGTMKAEIQYSTDPAFSTYAVLPYSTGLDNNYLRIDSLTRVNENIDVIVNDGETFYLRIYPWVDNDPSIRTGKYACFKDLIISGELESLPVEAAAVWAFNGDETYTTSGGLKANGPVYSDSLAYYGDTQLPLYGTADNVTVGAIQTVSQDWFTQTDTTDYYFIQFEVYPKFGATFQTDSISFYIGGWYSSNLRAAIYYSIDSDFSTGSLLIDDSPLVGNAVAKWQSSIDTTIEYGDTLYFRVYPYNTASEGWAKLVALHNVSIYGKSSGITAEPPVISTGELSYISTTFATCGGNISSDGGTPVTTRGMVWNTSGEATIDDDKTLDGLGSGSFVSQLTGLTPGTTYYVRAYGTNGAGTSYGDELTLVTLSSVIAPTVSTSEVSNVLVYSAKGGGHVSDWGGDTVDVRGVCWNTTGDPSISDSISEDGSGLGGFNSYLYPLSENTTYYARAYATNSAGTNYGSVDTFTTQIPSPDITVVVATDGSGDYTTVQAAFDDVPDNYTGEYTILVKTGTYYEKLFLDSDKINVFLKGVHADSTILTYDDNASSPNGSGGTVGTSGSYSVAIEADDFMAMDITFQNTNQDQQAVALRTNGDRQSFYRCKIEGYQDTYYAWGGRGTGRNYFKNCLIEGSVDFIFGRNIVVFDSCEIRENRNGGELTAAATEPESKFGFVFLDCIILADKIGFDGAAITSFSLGRPWQKAPQTVFINCYEPATLKTAGWDNWNVAPGLYAEYNCYGPGSDYSNRNPISRQLTDVEAEDYTVANIFSRASNPDYSFNWMPAQEYNKFNQSISFGPIPAKDVSEESFDLEAESSSNLPLSYTSSNTAVATIDELSVVLLASGSTDITASQSGNFMYNPASDVIQSLTITGELSIYNVNSNTLSIYPNPVKNLLVVERDKDELQYLTIVNLNGMVVLEELLNESRQEINVSSLKKGLYLIRINDKNLKLIIE